MTLEQFGKLPSGESVERYVLHAPGGPRVTVLTYGAIVQRIDVPDRDGRAANVVLHCDTLEDYMRRSRYFGAVVGRYGNRIAQGRFTLDGKTYELARNQEPNHLHGGERGFDRRVWRVEAVGDDTLTLSYTSPDGEEGYPGTLRATVTYTVTGGGDGDLGGGDLRIDYHATTDAPTVVNLTNHSYFNLAGAGNGDILGHVLTLDADRYLAVDEHKIPISAESVAGTPFDFTRPRAVGERMGEDHPQIAIGGGYDHCWIFNPGDGVKARLEDPGSGRVMEVLTTEPGVQFYAGGSLDSAATPYGPYAGLCLETQHFPDSPNRPDFPTTVLRPGEEYRSRTVYRFSTS
ncbi:aldose epimerase family protein [Thermostaphylospora chromogena]|uniref:Aldose 1-epimerase n=1 Tax=Thermostaphylospora chromogena TaxID=35622 RepID=A0A1H1FIL6_9ACTN|nr:aldose epimerase family protein [Thermostaphylospora chromogena]SDR00862.1 aldose 1-epimerase [Thermostaphylospora chromogena]